jgi:hypothetical protein
VLKHYGNKEIGRKNQNTKEVLFEDNKVFCLTKM